jgi:hypothetical protein
MKAMKILAALLGVVSLQAQAQISAGSGISYGPLPPFGVVSPTNGQCLTYNGTAWVNSSCISTLGQLPAQSPGTIVGVLSTASGTIAPSALTTLPFGLSSLAATGCSNSTVIGGLLALGVMTLASGSFHSGATGACTVALTLLTVAHVWSCSASDTTTTANIITQTVAGTLTPTISGNTVSGDVITFLCVGT